MSLDKFLSYIEIERNYSKHTLINYKSDLEELMVFIGKTSIEKIDYLLLRRFLGELRNRKLKSRTLSRKLSSLRSFFRFLQREGYVDHNPARLLCYSAR